MINPKKFIGESHRDNEVTVPGTRHYYIMARKRKVTKYRYNFFILKSKYSHSRT